MVNVIFPEAGDNSSAPCDSSVIKAVLYCAQKDKEKQADNQKGVTTMNKDMNKLNDQELEKVAGGTLTQDEAIARALEHAQLKKDQIDFVKKVEMDYEHGRKIYEISFYHDGFEYEFDIDAETGKILKYEKDWD